MNVNSRLLASRDRFTGRYNVIFGAALGAYLGVQVSSENTDVTAFGFFVILVSIALIFLAANIAVDCFYTEKFGKSVLGWTLAGLLSVSTYTIAPHYGFDSGILGAIFIGWGLMLLTEAIIYVKALDANEIVND